MNNYIRSAQKLIRYSHDILTMAKFSIDTKAIVLLLAATQTNNEFMVWIEAIKALEPIKDKCRAINLLQNHLGAICGKYVLLKILNSIEDDLSSDELQQFISDSKLTLSQREWLELAPNKAVTLLYNKSVNGFSS